MAEQPQSETTAPTQLEGPLVWVDLEMTGLEPDTDVILEIAIIVTDGKLDQIIEGPNLVIHASDELLDNMPQIVVDMHEASGLTDRVRASTLTVEEAESQVMEWLLQYVPDPNVAPLAGNSVHSDRAFMKKYMPTLEKHVHYRNVDVSTIKELVKRWAPEIAEQEPEKVGNHRALGDIRDSIDQLQFYRQRVFIEAVQ
ncbi:oligoribonuclease [Stomatohabitans albus]|uniref:oligoribonuclease n=1 Tax=Stomatohabitans albus TaxID=3110766 RepID=UPI00300DB022